MNLRRDIRKNPLQPGFFAVCGPQGVGKTSLCLAMLCQDYKKWRKYRVELAKEIAVEYYRLNRVRLNLTDHPYFSNIKIHN